MTTTRARALFVGLAALVASTAASGCVVHDRPGHGYYGRHGGVYYATPRRTTRYYYSSPYDRGHRVEHRRTYRYDDDRRYRRHHREYRYDRH